MGRGMVYPLCILPLLSNLLAKAIPLQMHAPPGGPNPLSGRSGVGRFFPYTAYTISYNGGYSSFLDLFHGIKSCHKGVRKTGRGQGGYRGIPPGRGPAPLTNPSDNLIMTTALEGKRPAAAVKNPIGRCRKNPKLALAEFAFSARCAGKEPVGKDIEGERKMLPHVSALSRWADEGPHF